MLMVDPSIADMTLATRSAELSSILGATQITDRSGKRIETEAATLRLLEVLRDLREREGSLYIVGNGGSAAVASHCVTDFVNVAQVRATTLHDSALLTCMANDYGYENAFARMLGTLSRKGDALFAVSSSGNSMNIRNAARAMRELDGAVVTLSGFAPDNPLRTLGDLNIWLDSRDYGMVEIGHQFVLHNLADRLRLEGARPKHV